MAKNKLKDLRDHLFETIEELKDKENPMDVERSKAISGVAQTIINSAKIELQFLELTGQESQSDFLGPLQSEPQALPAASSIRTRANGGDRGRRKA